MQKITCLILTFNSEKLVEKTLRSAQFCDEILVLDSGSTDATVEVVKKYGAKVVHQPWLGYGLQKRKGCELATHQWVINLDSDEELSTECQQAIQQVLQQPDLLKKHSAFKFYYEHIFLGQAIVRWHKSFTKKMRLFDKTRAHFDAVSVHERLSTSGSVGLIPHSIRHHSYEDLAHYFRKFNEYTSLGAQDFVRRGRRPWKLGVVCRWPFKFLQLYFFNGYFLCGWPGFVWSWLSACYGVVKYMKVIESLDRKTEK